MATVGRGPRANLKGRTVNLRTVTIGAVGAALLIVGLHAFTLIGTAKADAPSPDPSASAVPAPAPTPASAALVKWAMRWHRHAVRSRAATARAARALALHPPKAVKAPPARSCDAVTWVGAGQGWKDADREYRRQLARHLAKMRHPGGSARAAKWWPAARYEGWPERLKSWFCYIVTRESSARPWAINPSSGCYGLMQLHPCHWAAKYGRAWISDPLNQLWLAWQLYREAGPSPWAL